MQNYHLVIVAEKRPEILERILRVIRHRGFEIIDLQACSEEMQVVLKCRIQSKREIGLLTNQLLKLPDVVSLQNVG